MPIAAFTDGTTSGRNKFNQMRQIVNALEAMSGDGLIVITKGASGYTFRLATDRLRRYMPKGNAAFFYVHLLSEESPGAIFTWEEVELDEYGEWAAVSDGRTGAEARGFNDEEDVIDEDSGAPITVVLMFAIPNAGGEIDYRFVATGVGTPYAMFAVKVWMEEDSSTTNGDIDNQCDRTYNVRTLDATGPSTGGVELGTGKEPVKTRPTTGTLVVPSTTGDGVVGFGYYDIAGTFQLYDANEALDTTSCDEDSSG